MNFIKDRELALRFKNNTVPSNERFIYFFIFIILAMLVSSPSINHILNPNELNEWDRRIDIFMWVLTILGTISCYRTNQSGDGKEFIDRYIGIAFPITIQYILLMVPSMIVISIIRRHEIIYETSVYEFLVLIILTGYFYGRLNSSIRIASQ
mgnify:CR=1 FL=1